MKPVGDMMIAALDAGGGLEMVQRVLDGPFRLGGDLISEPQQEASQPVSQTGRLPADYSLASGRGTEKDDSGEV